MKHNHCHRIAHLEPRPTDLLISDVFCCRECGAPVALVAANQDDLVYQCLSERCGKAVHVDCPEGLAVIDDLTIELPSPADVWQAAKARGAARWDARHTPRCGTCAGEGDCPDCEPVGNIIDNYGQPIDPYAPLGACGVCGAAAWTTTADGLRCEAHESPTPHTTITTGPGQQYTVRVGCVVVGTYPTYRQARRAQVQAVRWAGKAAA